MRTYIDRKYRSYYIQCDMCGCTTKIMECNSNEHVALIKEGWVMVCGSFPDKDYCPACSKTIFKDIDLKAGPETYPCIEDALVDVRQEIQDLSKGILDKLDDIDNPWRSE